MRHSDEMLARMGLDGVDRLFDDIPEGVRIDGLALPDGLSEIEVLREVRAMLATNVTADDHPCFLGAGVYNHFVPSSVRMIVSRSEFLTSYTPYQAEVSQGMLQALFEYQSYIAELTGLDAVNSSNYDASTALGEAATMCLRLKDKKRFLIPEALSWEKKSVLKNYTWGPGMEVAEYCYDPYTGYIDLDDLASKVDENTCGIYAEVPNFFGVIDPLVTKLKGRFPDVALVVGIDPISLGVLKAPGDYGADIAIGEGQSLGTPMNFGGPLLGIFACRQEHVRKMPGRIIGMTRDADGERAFCMTLQTREQHIRRSKATSNICTNEALMAVAASVYLSVLGKEGLQTLAKVNISRARRLADLIDEIDGFDSPIFDAKHFNEFVIRTPTRPEKVNKLLLRKGVIGGLPMHSHVPRLDEHLLLCTTEMHSDDDQDRLVAGLKEVA
ncbi:MAG TPA: aminomethyl-transferring glycine dehydrogenase subunit GcvPA, partial [Methanomassiliicoccales archaeon]|nr:aminomethyl-transferring glycine dehydrogenase subunit GcvPA [Methanomassiliicoccales archaeon]